MADRCSHFLHGKAFAVIMNFHYNAFGSDPDVYIHALRSCVLRRVRQGFLADVE